MAIVIGQAAAASLNGFEETRFRARRDRLAVDGDGERDESDGDLHDGEDEILKQLMSY